MISLEEIKNLALLARIELGVHEEKELQKELGAILDYVSQLKEAPVREIEVSMPKEAKAPKILNVSREDKPIKEDAVIKKGEHIKVKHIL